MLGTSYLDTSFVLKSYLFEQHSAEVTQFISAPGPRPLVSSLTDVEVAAALAQKLSSQEARAAFELYQKDRREGVFASVGVARQVYALSQILALRFGPDLRLRSLDVLHLATAYHHGALQMATYDRRLAMAAVKLGLSVIGAEV